jgi:peptidoglycan/LPS O-acetylase OafA/YrhL
MISIIIFHTFQNANLGLFFPKWEYRTNFGDKAVEMFFIISGFLLVYTLNIQNEQWRSEGALQLRHFKGLLLISDSMVASC